MKRYILPMLLTLTMIMPLASNAVAQSQLPSKPLPVIVRIVTHPLCGLLQNTVGPTVQGLLLNDTSINQASFFLGRALAHGNGRFLMLARSEQLAAAVAQRISVMQKLMSSEALNSASGSPAEKTRVAQLKARLQEAITDQQAALNLLYGSADSASLKTAMTSRDIKSGLVSDGRRYKTISPYDVGPLDALNPAYAPAASALPALASLHQVSAMHESQLASSIFSATHECARLNQEAPPMRGGASPSPLTSAR